MADSKEFYSDAIALMKTIARGNQSSKKVIGTSKPKGKLFKKADKGKGAKPKPTPPSKGGKPGKGGMGGGGKGGKP